MPRDFEQTTWDAAATAAGRQLMAWAIQEDLAGGLDMTCEAIVPPQANGSAQLVTRASGVVAGLTLIPLVLAAIRDVGIAGQVEWHPHAADGEGVAPGHLLGRLTGNARGILAAERTVLNGVGHLSGVATQTRRYVEAVRPHAARIYDTRKTLAGWRRLEKYAVRCGGGYNHRLGLHAAIMCKDNHLALANSLHQDPPHTPVLAVARAKEYRQAKLHPARESILIEIELDRLDHFQEVLAAAPDLILLDNMSIDMLRAAVNLRNQAQSAIPLEASGGVTLETVALIAATGIDRISVGALTHSAPQLDVALDWE